MSAKFETAPSSPPVPSLADLAAEKAAMLAQIEAQQAEIERLKKASTPSVSAASSSTIDASAKALLGSALASRRFGSEALHYAADQSVDKSMWTACGEGLAWAINNGHAGALVKEELKNWTAESLAELVQDAMGAPYFVKDGPSAKAFLAARFPPKGSRYVD